MEKNQIPYFSKNCSICVPTILSLDNSDTITNPYDIANTFNNYLASIAESSSTLFLQPTDKEGIANIISSLNSNKASGPNSIP